MRHLCLQKAAIATAVVNQPIALVFKSFCWESYRQSYRRCRYESIQQGKLQVTTTPLSSAEGVTWENCQQHFLLYGGISYFFYRCQWRTATILLIGRKEGKQEKKSQFLIEKPVCHFDEIQCISFSSFLICANRPTLRFVIHNLKIFLRFSHNALQDRVGLVVFRNRIPVALFPLRHCFNCKGYWATTLY